MIPMISNDGDASGTKLARPLWPKVWRTWCGSRCRTACGIDNSHSDYGIKAKGDQGTPNRQGAENLDFLMRPMSASGLGQGLSDVWRGMEEGFPDVVHSLWSWERNKQGKIINPRWEKMKRNSENAVSHVPKDIFDRYVTGGLRGRH